MDEQMKSRLTSKDVWVRGLYMIFFLIAWGVSEILLVFSAIFQFLSALFSGSANLPLLQFGQNLSRYHYQIARYVTFNTEERPFPFSDWPDDPPGGERWMDNGATTDLTPSGASTDSSTAGEPVVVEDDAAATSVDADATAAEADESVSESRKDEAPPPA